MKILVTGGAGYIGSHAVVELIQGGHEVFVLDSLANSSRESLVRVEKITGLTATFILGDICDRMFLDSVFNDYSIDAVMHFAGLKAVGESERDPLLYYRNNVAGSITLIEAMKAAGVFRLVFSSSATVYGEPEVTPVAESCPTGVPSSPYGRTKLMVEQVLQDLAASESRWSIALLRYFNPVGAHPSGLIGEFPKGKPNNLLPYVCQVAIGKLERLAVFGEDYPTKDGTGVRDYVHVVDLAKGHMAALNFIFQQSGAHVWNLGTGIGYSVNEVVAAFELVSGKRIPRHVVPRRAGDVAESWADPTKASLELGWKASAGLTTMIEDAWRWQLLNPAGYEG